jgi:hypothetical protein
MSYFATIAGPHVGDVSIDGVTLIEPAKAQEYVRQRIPAIASLDGEPVYFCDDNVTGTSDDFIGDAKNYALEHRTLTGHPIMQLLWLCDRTGAVLRIWNAGSFDFRDVVSCKNASEAAQMMVVDQRNSHWHVRVAP